MSYPFVPSHVTALIVWLRAQPVYAATFPGFAGVGRRPGANVAPKSWYVGLSPNGMLPGDGAGNAPVSHPRVQFIFYAPTMEGADLLAGYTQRLLIPEDGRNTPIIESNGCRIWSPDLVADIYTDVEEPGEWPISVAQYAFWKLDVPLEEEP